MLRFSSERIFNPMRNIVVCSIRMYDCRKHDRFFRGFGMVFDPGEHQNIILKLNLNGKKYSLDNNNYYPNTK